MVSYPSKDNDASSAVPATGDEKLPTPPSGVESAVMQELAPLSVQQTTTSVAREVTIRQVAPLVLVLTGATFLNVSLPPLLQPRELTSSDHLRSICGYYSAFNKQRPEYPRDKATMDRLSLCPDRSSVSSPMREAGGCIWQAPAFHSRVFLDHCYYSRGGFFSG